jgi:hypothetical protein
MSVAHFPDLLTLGLNSEIKVLKSRAFRAHVPSPSCARTCNGVFGQGAESSLASRLLVDAQKFQAVS